MATIPLFHHRLTASASTAEVLIRSLLEEADIHIDGHRSWDIRVHDEHIYNRVLAGGSLALGESYMDGWWDCDQLDECVYRVLRAKLYNYIPMTLNTFLTLLRVKFFNPQTLSGSRKVADRHYNLGNDFYAAMLDPYMQYSCGYWKDADNLTAAQENKLELICRKLQLTESDHVLDIGCGWGGFAKYAAQRYGCQVTGINISTEQIAFARDFCQDLPVEIINADYRTMSGTFDKIVSVGMFEHVGAKNYRAFVNVILRCLKKDGLFLLHTIGENTPSHVPERWISKYIFPNSYLPAPTLIADAIDKRFTLEDWHNFGAYYDKTLMAWHRNFSTAWPQFKNRYGERFERMWRYYLLSCAGSFRARCIQLWQIALSPHGEQNGYMSVR